MLDHFWINKNEK